MTPDIKTMKNPRKIPQLPLIVQICVNMFKYVLICTNVRFVFFVCN